MTDAATPTITIAQVMQDMIEAMTRLKRKAEIPWPVEGLPAGWEPVAESIADQERFYALDLRLIKSYPGSGKTREATYLLNWLWEKNGKRGLYLMLSHDAIDEVERRLQEEGKRWAHWKGHNQECQIRTLAEKGYPGRGTCTCGHGADTEADGPAIAPIEYILEDSHYGVKHQIFNYDLWIIDEIDLRRFLGKMTASAEDVKAVAARHPDESFRVLSQALHKLMLRPVPKRLSGKNLYQYLDAELQRLGTDLQSILASLRRGKHQHNMPLEDRNNPVTNFPPRLWSAFVYEADRYLKGGTFNPRIHIVHTDKEPELRIWWRNKLADREIGEPEFIPSAGWIPEGFWHPPLLVLDASADPELMKEVLDIESAYPSQEPEWPAQVHVSQYADATIGRGSMGLYPRSTALSPKGTSIRESYYERVVRDVKALPQFDPDWPVGLITFSGIVDVFDMVGEAREYLTEAGLNVIETGNPLWYYNLRGSNELEHVKVLVLLGCPIPAPDGFLEEAQAFFPPYMPLSGNSVNDFDDALHLVDGSEFPVKVRGYLAKEYGKEHGYVDDRLQRYFEQKTKAELYQAVHRIRPHLVKADDERFVLIYTNMPVPGVKVEKLLRNEVKERTDARLERAATIIKEHVAENGKCLKRDLVKELTAAEGNEKRAIEKWIERSISELEGATGTRFHLRQPGQPAHFAT